MGWGGGLEPIPAVVGYSLDGSHGFLANSDTVVHSPVNCLWVNSGLVIAF